MTEQHIIQAISVNMMKIAEWHYANPEGTRVICERYLEQSRELGEKVFSPPARAYLDYFSDIHLSDTTESHAKTAERCLTLGVLLQGIKQ